MSWYTYRFWGSWDGDHWQDVTDIAPHPKTTIGQAVAFAKREVQRSELLAYPYLQLQRRQGTYRIRGDWKTLAHWECGVQTMVQARVTNAVDPIAGSDDGPTPRDKASSSNSSGDVR